MTIKYTVIEHPIWATSIKAELEDGTLLSIPTDPANSDYQAYLKSLEAEQSTPMVTDEAATL